jgi:hypothetical protein
MLVAVAEHDNPFSLRQCYQFFVDFKHSTALDVFVVLVDDTGENVLGEEGVVSSPKFNAAAVSTPESEKDPTVTLKL